MFGGGNDCDGMLQILPTVLDTLFVINGVYDLLCAVACVLFPNTPIFSTLAKIHRGMYRDHSDCTNPVVNRLLGYWIACYGMVRVAMITQNTPIAYLAAGTYVLEALAWCIEGLAHQAAVRARVVPVVILSVLMAGAAGARPMAGQRTF